MTKYYRKNRMSQLLLCFPLVIFSECWRFSEWKRCTTWYTWTCLDETIAWCMHSSFLLGSLTHGGELPALSRENWRPGKLWCTIFTLMNCFVKTASPYLSFVSAYGPFYQRIVFVANFLQKIPGLKNTLIHTFSRRGSCLETHKEVVYFYCVA